MESNYSSSISIEIPNYSGPLETLLDLAKNQKVDLTQISVAILADHFLEFIKKFDDKNLDLAFEYLLMATWLTYLKSKLLLPETDEEEFKALEVAEKLKLQLKKLELIRLLSDQMIKGKRLGREIFLRGIKGKIKSIYSSKYSLTLYELLKSYSSIVMKREFQRINIPKLPVLTTEDGIKRIQEFFGKLLDWKNLNDLIPDDFAHGKDRRRSGLAGLFAGSLELTKEGDLSIKQNKLFENIYIKENNE